MLNSHLTKSRRRWKLHRRLKPKLTPSRRTIASCLHVGWILEHFIARSLCLSCCKVIDQKTTLKFLGSSELVLVCYPPVLRTIFCIGSAAEPVMLRHCWDNFLCPCAPAPFAQTSRSGCQSWLVALLSHDGAQQDAHLLQATWNVFYWSQLFFSQYACWPTIFSQYAWGMIVYDDDYLCVCNISGFPAGKCTAPLVWALWIILLPVLIHMEWGAVDNPLEFWFKSVSRVHQGTIINCHSIAWRWLVLWFLRKVGSFALSAIQGHSDKCIFVYWVCFGPDSLRAVPSRPIILPVICQVLTGCLRASGHPRREQGHTSPGSDHGGKNAHTLGMGCTEASYSNPST